MVVLVPNFAFLDKHFLTRRFADNFPTVYGGRERAIAFPFAPLPFRQWCNCLPTSFGL